MPQQAMGAVIVPACTRLKASFFNGTLSCAALHSRTDFGLNKIRESKAVPESGIGQTQWCRCSLIRIFLGALNPQERLHVDHITRSHVTDISPNFAHERQ